jgi:hypothetical protein
MAKKRTSTAATSAAVQSGGASESAEIGLLIAASHFVREAGGWRDAEGQLRAVQNFVNTCGGFDRALELVESLEAIRANLDGLAPPDHRSKQTVETVE